MSNIVIQLNSTEQAKVHAYYASDKVDRNAPGVIFAAKSNGTSITSYKSGKVMFQGGKAENEANRWSTPNTPKTKTSSKGDTLPPNFENMSVIGSDETGTGDYFGPITVAAVYVSSDKIELVKELGVKDSKMLSDDFMRKIAPDLISALPHSLLILHNPKYNEVQEKGWSQGKIKAILHNQALRKVLEKIAPEKPDYILIDQFAERKVYYNHMKSQPVIIEENVLFATKAEQLHLSVAAASIIARYAFLREMDKLSKSVGITLPKGAGHQVDEVAAKILLAQGEDELRQVTKWHFANTTKASRIASKKRFL
ncbi:ribonuclease HIII [Kurthia zopfii]|uniref:Ribonuclease HIII n=1 Tax=Kurthia zopfii TaxID=1650 RepID=A0A2U3AF26_9BACL|nr:ribonuclease HIII [Kurthia zopfii]PWI23051.1 ribonuclease HIII [Kurthia zopfii]TDR40511.1 ribonuclease HIII [Kurthia zopfii]STX10250.1 Ribonuclease HIII [Kurthia zopfii]VEI08185.1 Ribonuclease HIII [Kurthia zopfii]GEK30070.1 ribonuclease HIII [Kurthia zopfii]